LDQHDYRQFAHDDLQKLRLLIKGEIIGTAPVPSFASKLQGANRSRERSILNFVARVPPASANSAESAADWLVQQARSPNKHMRSVVSFFEKEMSNEDVAGSIFDSACSDDADVSKHSKDIISK
jgi:hypothetical protein